MEVHHIMHHNPYDIVKQNEKQKFINDLYTATTDMLFGVTNFGIPSNFCTFMSEQMNGNGQGNNNNGPNKNCNGRSVAPDRKRPYPCNLCPRRFGSKMELEEHQNSHTGMKPFECDFYPVEPRVKGSIFFHEVAHLVGLPHRSDEIILDIPNCPCNTTESLHSPEQGCLKIPRHRFAHSAFLDAHYTKWRKHQKDCWRLREARPNKGNRWKEKELTAFYELCKKVTEPVTDGELLTKVIDQLSTTKEQKETLKVKDNLETYASLVKKIESALDSTGNLAAPNADSDELMTQWKALLEKERWLWKNKDFNCGYMMIVYINMRRGVPQN